MLPTPWDAGYQMKWLTDTVPFAPFSSASLPSILRYIHSSTAKGTRTSGRLVEDVDQPLIRSRGHNQRSLGFIPSFERKVLDLFGRKIAPERLSLTGVSPH
nr:MAG TPA: hypothetical protein [Caudoviricetes sp.]